MTGPQRPRGFTSGSAAAACVSEQVSAAPQPLMRPSDSCVGSVRVTSSLFHAVEGMGGEASGERRQAYPSASSLGLS